MTQVDFRPVEKATRSTRGEVGRIGVAVLFIVGVIVFTGAAFGHVEQAYLLIAAAVIGGYMALNIGANDVANNVGPAVGSMAMTMATAIGIAAVFEAAGAIIAGGDVVDTVKNGIIDPDSIADPQIFVWVMLGSLLGAALWLNIATFMGAPVSTTHAIVGGVLGGGVASSGWAIVNWDVMGSIAMSWVISPLVGGLIAAGTLYLLKRTVLFRDEPVDAATRVVPLLIAVMAWAFATYLALKGLSNLVSISFPVALFGGLVIAVITYAVVRPMVIRAAPGLTQDTEGVNSLFTIPLICAAALLSFAHGANDVANAVGPLAGIVEVLDGGAAGVRRAYHCGCSSSVPWASRWVWPSSAPGSSAPSGPRSPTWTAPGPSASRWPPPSRSSSPASSACRSAPPTSRSAASSASASSGSSSTTG